MSGTSRSIELQRIPSRSDPVPGPSIPATPVTSIPNTPVASIYGHDADVENDPMGERERERGDTIAPSSLHPVDGGMHAWRFLAAATFVETTVWGLPFTIGVLHTYWNSQMFPNDESTLTLAATLQTGLMYISTAMLGPLFAAFPRQRQLIQMIGLVVSTVALIATGFVTRASHLVVTMGVLYPFAGALYLPCATLLYEWFQQRRGLATGIMFAGTGVGGTVFPFIVSALLGKFGHRATMIALGVGYGLSNAIALLFIKRRVPIPKRASKHAPRMNIDWSVAKTRGFWCGFFVLLLTSLGNFNPTLWIPSFADTVDSKRPNGTALVAIMNAASIPGNTLTGWISDRVPPRVTITGSCLVATISVLVLWGLGTSSALLIVFSVIWGLTALSFVALWSKMISKICKDDPTLSVLVFSMFAVLRGVGNLTSGPVSTALLQTGVFRGAAGAYGTTNFGAVLIYTAVTIFCGGVVGIFFPK